MTNIRFVLVSRSCEYGNPWFRVEIRNGNNGGSLSEHRNIIYHKCHITVIGDLNSLFTLDIFKQIMIVIKTFYVTVSETSE